MDKEQRIHDLVSLVSQLEKAVGIIANRAGDYTQNIVYEALVEVGYYIDEEELEEDIDD